jgi:hypothetical protein
MTRRPRRPWLLGIVLFLCAAVAAGAGIVLGSRAQPPAAAPPGSTAAPAAPAPGKTQAQADLAAMQSVLNSGSVAKQAALLVPPMRFASGSGPVLPPSTTITISPGSLHSSGQSGTVQARISDGTTVTLGLYSVQGHWRLYGAQAGSVQTKAAITGQPVTVRLMADMISASQSIAMVITIGTPNTGSLLGNAHDVFCGAIGAGIELAWHGACTQFQAASAMAVFNPEIMTLPKLPPSVPLHAIAGDETYVFKLLGAQVAWPFFGDGVVTTGSALDKRPGWKDDTFDTVANPFVLDDTSAFHLRLTSNPNVQVLVDRYISDYLRSHPVQAAQAVLGGDAYWLADGGTWTVHGLQLQISRGPSGLIGTQTWNAGGNIEIGHAQLAFTSNADGSLTGTYIATGTHTYTKTPPAGFIPEPDTDLPQQGQTIMLVPVSPHLAKTVYNGNSPSLFVGGNTNLCQDGLANASQYCGA